ncbi:predicted protein [Postia placenta Mad-698-R]|nr:predicted protein [Postia placenta Mad-698-R]
MNSRPPPGSGMILRAYNANLRPVVIVVALLSAVWSLFSCVVLALFAHHLSLCVVEGYPKLGTFAIVLGSVYAATCGIEIFGVTAASLQRMRMARLYALLTVVSALAIVGAGLIRVIVHFMLKNELIDECTKIAKGDTVIEQFGFWGPTFETKLNQSEANTCEQRPVLASALLDEWSVPGASLLYQLWAGYLLSKAPLFVRWLRITTQKKLLYWADVVLLVLKVVIEDPVWL